MQRINYREKHEKLNKQKQTLMDEMLCRKGYGEGQGGKNIRLSGRDNEIVKRAT